MSKRSAVWSAATLLVLSACVTINIYFPAAEAERAADTIIRDVISEQPEVQEAPVEEKSSLSLEAAPLRVVSSRSAWLEWVIPSVYAAADLNIDSPAIRKLTASMKKRFRSLEPAFKSGALGYTKDGLVALRDPKLVALKERNTLKKRVAAENKDRNSLYREIAKANGHPEWEKDIRATFARRWVANAPKGWWHQDAKGKWKRK